MRHVKAGGGWRHGAVLAQILALSSAISGVNGCAMKSR
jgi:hypothetical protein